VLLAAAHVKGADIADRERWEGIVLSVTEAAGVFRAMSDAADDGRADRGAHALGGQEARRRPRRRGATAATDEQVVAFGREVRRGRVALGSPAAGALSASEGYTRTYAR